MRRFELIATAAFGLEAVVAKELKELGYTDQMVENGRVTFWGDEEAICRANLWLRAADRVLLKMGEFTAQTFDELFEKTRALPWTEWLPENAEFPVSGKSVKSRLYSVPDCQAIVKKAMVEKMKEKYRTAWFPENGPRYKIEVGILKDTVTLTVDTSGTGLHKRGYRRLTGTAPLRETLAAALVLLSKWQGDKVLADPFCGSGTIPVEAALIGLNIAPGLGREFDAERWPRVPVVLWDRTRKDARDAAVCDRVLRVIGTDQDENAISQARYHARQAGVDGQIHFQRLPFAEFRSRYDQGYVICNPPYGERLGEVRQAEELYREMRRVFVALGSWSFFVLAAHPDFEKLFGRLADKKRKLYNGRIQCNLYQYNGQAYTAP
jgi:putative N6-adenine-specific DNA methylase